MTDKAVLCGINVYKSISSLKGCLNDLEDVQRMLIDNFQFSAANIRVYRDKEVTKPTIEDAFDWLAGGAGPGDRLVFHYSGHGSYTKSKSPDKDIDELLCMYDMQWSNENSFLRDTHLGGLTRKIPAGARMPTDVRCNRWGHSTDIANELVVDIVQLLHLRISCLDERHIAQGWQSDGRFGG